MSTNDEAMRAGGKRLGPARTLFGGGMTSRMTLIAAVAMLAAQQAAGAPLSCPKTAPPAWGLPSAKLESVRVMSFPPDQPPVDGQPLPVMAPFNEWRRGGLLYQSWNMNFDAPRFQYQVDCLYSGTDRYLRLDAPSVGRCIAKLNRHNTIDEFTCK